MRSNGAEKIKSHYCLALCAKMCAFLYTSKKKIRLIAGK